MFLVAWSIFLSKITKIISRKSTKIKITVFFARKIIKRQEALFKSFAYLKGLAL